MRKAPKRPRPRTFAAAMAITVLIGAIALFASRRATADAPTLRVGSKRFTESYVLAEMLVAIAQSEAKTKAIHVEGLGGTAIVFRALEQGAIDVYPEYTGTIAEALLSTPGKPPPDAQIASLRPLLAARGIGVSASLGFENRYALAAPTALAERIGLRTVSDLAKHPSLRLGLSPEFRGRSDGWPGLRERYGLGDFRVEEIAHGLSFEALKAGAVDVTDIYSTDAKIKKYDLRVLDDDRHFFPPYEAVLLYRLDAPARFPDAFRAFEALNGRLTENTVIELNSRVELDGATSAETARAFVDGGVGVANAPTTRVRKEVSLASSIRDAVVEQGARHLALVFVSLALAILVGIPFGIWATRSRAVGAAVLAGTGLVQTIPALALLCFFIPILGIGFLPTVAALFLYGLLPIVRNTVAGIEAVSPLLRETAAALGLPARSRILRIELPLASRTILAGIKTSAVVNVGTATIAAFIGAGGFGQPISTGLNLNDNTLILAGAIPAAALALITQAVFDVLERWVVPRGLKLEVEASSLGPSGPSPR